MVIETQVSFKKYRSFCYSYVYSHPFYRVLTLYGIVMLAGLFFYTPDNDVILFLQIVTVIIILLVIPLRVKRNAEKRFEASNLLNEKKIYEFTPDKLTVTGETFKAEYQWDKLSKMRELKNWVVILFGKNVGFVIPKEAFGNNMEEFRELVKSKIPGNK